MDYKISSEASGFGPLQAHIYGQWPKQQITITKTCVLKVIWKRRENENSLMCLFFNLDVLTFPQKRRQWDSSAGFHG